MEKYWIVFALVIAQYDSVITPVRRSKPNPALSCQGKSETLGFYIGVDEIGYCYPVGDHSK
jgi:hypothetical protein